MMNFFDSRSTSAQIRRRRETQKSSLLSCCLWIDRSIDRSYHHKTRFGSPSCLVAFDHQKDLKQTGSESKVYKGEKGVDSSYVRSRDLLPKTSTIASRRAGKTYRRNRRPRGPWRSRAAPPAFHEPFSSSRTRRSLSWVRSKLRSRDE